MARSGPSGESLAPDSDQNMRKTFIVIAFLLVGCGASAASVKRGACHVVTSMCAAATAVCSAAEPETTSGDQQ